MSLITTEAVATFGCNACGAKTEIGRGKGRPLGWARLQFSRVVERRDNDVSVSAFESMDHDLCVTCADRVAEFLHDHQ